VWSECAFELFRDGSHHVRGGGSHLPVDVNGKPSVERRKVWNECLDIVPRYFGGSEIRRNAHKRLCSRLGIALRQLLDAVHECGGRRRTLV